jgi:hypothetical protein
LTTHESDDQSNDQSKREQRAGGTRAEPQEEPIRKRLVAETKLRRRTPQVENRKRVYLQRQVRRAKRTSRTEKNL